MGKLSKDAFAIMAMCEETKKHFGITVDPRQGHFEFVWCFKIKEDQAKREGYDRKSVRGAVAFDNDYNGCPYCGSKSFYLCHNCGKVVCYHGQEQVTCPNCGVSGGVCVGESFDLSGGGF